MDEKERARAAEKLAADVLSLARGTLAVNLRFLERPLFRLQFKSGDRPWFASDGQRLYFEPWYVLGQYKAEPNAVNRDLLHLLLHLIYRHGYIGAGVRREYWDLAADIAVESIICDMGLGCTSSKREAGERVYLELLKKELPVITAERVYKWLRDSGMSAEDAKELRQKFFGDEHGVWYRSDSPEALKLELEPEEVWEEISKRVQNELELIEDDKSGPLVQSLRDLNRVRYDYTKFLRRFGVWGETLRVSDEEFDNNYYTYGLGLYGNLPLIEPLEYREQRRIREFVIAIDTSGSVKGEVVQSFIQHTHDILSRQENFFTKVNMHILQCDDRIREDVRISCKEDFDAYLSSLEIKGLGETDFRPVFSYVDELIRKRELTDLRGLIYFTDGLGIFPARKPDYETAFILHRSDWDEPEIPVWAMHMSMSEDEVMNLGRH